MLMLMHILFARSYLHVSSRMIVLDGSPLPRRVNRSYARLRISDRSTRRSPQYFSVYSHAASIRVTIKGLPERQQCCRLAVGMGKRLSNEEEVYIASPGGGKTRSTTLTMLRFPSLLALSLIYAAHTGAHSLVSRDATFDWSNVSSRVHGASHLLTRPSSSHRLQTCRGRRAMTHTNVQN